MFLDERGSGLRVTWHPERDLVVLSVWHDDRCVGTFRLPVQDVPRLSGLLAAALGDWVGQTAPFPGIEEPEAGGPGVGAGWGGGGSRGGEREGHAYGPGGPRSVLGGPRPDAGGPRPDAGGPRPDAGGPRPDVGGPQPGVGGSRSGLGGGDYSLSMQQRLRLSRPVLKLRGLQHRRGRLG